ncbi:hypothetical protein Bhyg_12449 [Pseudolycoriella hygida]|uniref:Uncharacterized protein n=1 Tax=Pseudolycoriella hygida TaxID=35572 RepID=A0A9Q0MZK8_9DIPT|nr:hypothetical protein Bhyg_12449 [Pseudolycoriella hygida]
MQKLVYKHDMGQGAKELTFPITTCKELQRLYDLIIPAKITTVIMILTK